MTIENTINELIENSSSKGKKKNADTINKTFSINDNSMKLVNLMNEKGIFINISEFIKFSIYSFLMKHTKELKENTIERLIFRPFSREEMDYYALLFSSYEIQDPSYSVFDFYLKRESIELIKNLENNFLKKGILIRFLLMKKLIQISNLSTNIKNMNEDKNSNIEFREDTTFYYFKIKLIGQKEYKTYKLKK